MFFGRVKGEAEKALRELIKTTPSFQPYSPRPGVVDPSLQPAIQPFLPRTFKNRSVWWLNPTLRAVFPKSMISPTQDLGKVLVELAMSDGKPLEGEGISGEGRTLSNVALRRLAGI